MPMTPVRRAWLAAGVPVGLILVGWIGLNLVALIGPGQFVVGHGLPAGPGPVTVHVSNGNVHLREVAGDQAGLTGTAHYTLVRPRFTTRLYAGGADFGYDCTFPIGNCGLDATVSVPRGRPASVRIGGGDAVVTGTTGDVTVTTGGGDVTAARDSGHLTLTTNGGDITGTAITASGLTAHTDGGDVTVQFDRVPTNVKITTDGGDITIVVPPGSTHYDLTEDTGGGTTSARVPTDSSSPHVITAITSGGDISVSRS